MSRMSVAVGKAFMYDANQYTEDYLFKQLHLNYFQLLGCSQSYFINLKSLESAYFHLQKCVHPDRFADRSHGQLIAIKYAALVNEAYETLKSPIKRAQYLLQLKGVFVDEQCTTVSDDNFLETQMTLRESLMDISKAQKPPYDELAMLRTKASNQFNQLSQSLETLFQINTQDAFQDASNIVQKMHFVSRLLEEIKAKERHYF